MDRRRVVAALFAIGAVTASLVPTARAEEATVRATAAWRARARIFVTGPQQVFVLGVFGGRLAIESGPSPLQGAQLLCPGALDADYTANTQHGQGRCVITAGSGDRVFARWTCAGEPDHGCAGRFVLTGGTGAFQGVTGGGEVTFRLVLSDVVQFERQEAEYDLAGVASWPELKYRTP